MEKEMLGELLIHALKKYNFKNYGSKLFYLELEDSIIILEQTNYRGCAEMYLSIIIKECHPEISKITKIILKDDLLIDNHTVNKLLYYTPNGYRWDFYDIGEKDFEKTIDEFYNENIKSFETDYMSGIEHYNELYYKIAYGHQIRLYKDSAEKIGHPELGSNRGHDFLLSDYYYLTYKCKIDLSFVNSNTEKYIIENVIKQSPKDLTGKELSKWRNERCKEILIAKKMWHRFGCGMTFPFIDGKPLKFYGTDIKDKKAVEVYINEETGELYHCRRTTNRFDDQNIQYELYKVE